MALYKYRTVRPGLLFHMSAQNKHDTSTQYKHGTLINFLPNIVLSNSVGKLSYSPAFTKYWLEWKIWEKKNIRTLYSHINGWFVLHE